MDMMGAAGEEAAAACLTAAVSSCCRDPAGSSAAVALGAAVEFAPAAMRFPPPAPTPAREC